MAPTPTPTDTLDSKLVTTSTLALSPNNSTADASRLKTLEVLFELAKVEAANEKDRRMSFVVFVFVIGIFAMIGFLIYSLRTY